MARVPRMIHDEPEGLWSNLERSHFLTRTSGPLHGGGLTTKRQADAGRGYRSRYRRRASRLGPCAGDPSDMEQSVGASGPVHRSSFLQSQPAPFSGACRRSETKRFPPQLTTKQITCRSGRVVDVLTEGKSPSEFSTVPRKRTGRGALAYACIDLQLDAGSCICQQPDREHPA